MAHKRCIIAHTFKLARQGLHIICPKEDCRKIIQEFELKSYLGDLKEEFDKILIGNFIK